MARKVQSIYNYFSEYPKEGLDEVIDELSEKEQQSLRRRYGNDLNNPNPPKDYTKEEKEYFYGTLIPKIRRHLRKKFKTLNSNKNSGPKRRRKITSLYEALSDYPKEEIDKLVAALPDNQKEIVRIRFGSDLENPKEERALTKKESETLLNTIIPKLKRNLAKRTTDKLNLDKKNVQEGTIESLDVIEQVQAQQVETPKESVSQVQAQQVETPKESVLQVQAQQVETPKESVPQVQTLQTPVLQVPTQSQLEINNPKEETEPNSLTTKEGLKEMLEILKKPSFITLLEVMTPKEAIVFCLRLGTGGKAFKANDIAEFIETDVWDVYDTTNRAIDIFQENVDMLLKKEQEHNHSLKLSTKDFSKKM